MRGSLAGPGHRIARRVTAIAAVGETILFAWINALIRAPCGQNGGAPPVLDAGQDRTSNLIDSEQHTPPSSAKATMKRLKISRFLQLRMCATKLTGRAQKRGFERIL
ncbi:hypothetical protein CHN51_06585 [Sphingorhabdus sp. YGSMI21]|nr:hypothetical protein CHN51_06585 [Sphingorhabdus sp. YGSMI21]